MSSTFFAQNLDVSGNVVFDKATNNLTIAVTDQATGAATLTVPDLGGVSQDFVGTTHTQTLTNKTVSSSILTAESSTVFESATGTARQTVFDISGASDSTATTLDFNQTANRTITFPDATGTLGLQASGADNQLLRMNMTDMTQASSVTLSDANEFANVRSLTAESGQNLTLTAATDQDLVLTTDAGQVVSIPQNLSVGNDVTVTGNLTVNGTTTTINSTTVNIADNNFLISSNYTTAVGRAGGITVNYLPTAVTASVSGAAFASTSTVNAAGGGYSANDIILIESANDPANNGIYQVLSYADPLITIDTTPSHGFLGDTLVADATVAGTITTINVAVLCAGASDGKWEVAQGSNASTLTFTDLALVSDIPAGGWTEVDVATTTATLTTAATIPVTAGKSTELEVVFTARNQANSDSHGGRMERYFENSGGTVTAVGAGTKSLSTVGGGSAWSVSTTVSGSNALIQVQGVVANIDWRILYRYTESP